MGLLKNKNEEQVIYHLFSLRDGVLVAFFFYDQLYDDLLDACGDDVNRAL